jgi:hypothetical protein
MLKPRSVVHDEITTPVLKYRIGDLEEKIVAHHSEVLQRFAYIEGKLDSMSKSLQETSVRNDVDHAEMKKDIAQNKNDINSISIKLWAVLLVIIGGISKLVFDLIQGKG